MQLISKFLSRRLLIVYTSAVVPVVYQTMGIQESVTLAVVGIMASYILGRAYSDKKTG